MRGVNAPLYQPPSADDLRLARAELVRLDPALARLDRATPDFEWRLRPGGFAGLVKMVIEQQVSIAAAASIWNRFATGLGEITPERVLGHDEEGLKQFGLSRPKARYVLAIAQAQTSGTIDFAKIASLDDAEAIAALTALKGVGRWTAETYLMFCHGRLDVFPGGDVALQEALRWADNALERPNEKQAYLRAEAWQPYRGVAAHLLWRCYGGGKRGEIGLD